jgi:Mg-chelatase subunit ChlD
MPNDAESLKRATKYVEKMAAGGGTAMMSALQFIAAKLLPGGDVDTIYLLSDGAPTDARPEEVLAVAKNIHEDFHVKFHTIGLGESEGLVVTQDRPPSLLDQIAKATGGAYVAR